MLGECRLAYSDLESFFEQHGILCGTVSLGNDVTGVVLLLRFEEPHSRFMRRRQKRENAPQWLVWARPFFDAGQDDFLDDGWTVIRANIRDFDNSELIFAQPIHWIFDAEIVSALAHLYLTPQIGFVEIRLPDFETRMLFKAFKIVNRLPIRILGDIRNLIHSIRLLPDSEHREGLIENRNNDETMILARENGAKIADQLIMDDEFRMKIDYILTELQYAGFALSVARYEPAIRSRNS